MKTRKTGTFVRAYMTHARTPFITLEYADGSVRKVARWQSFDPTFDTDKFYRSKYGERWEGVRVLPSCKCEESRSNTGRML